MNRFKRFLKYGTRKDVKIFIGLIAIISLFYLLCYELWWYEIPASTIRIERCGVLFSRIFYSILASSIFFYISQYFPIILPRRERKLKVLDIVYHKAISIDWYLSRVRAELNVMFGEFADVEKWRTILDNIDVNAPVSGFPNWYEYFRHLRERIVELTRGITIHSEYLSLEFLQEVVIIEQQLLTPGIFEGPPYINTGNLRWAEIQLQEVLVHNRILQDVRIKEWENIKHELDLFGREYRKTNFSSHDDEQKRK